MSRFVKKHFKSTMKRVAEVQELVSVHYEPGRQDRSKRWVWRTKVWPKYGISEKTFYMYLGMGKTDEVTDNRDLRLF